MSERTDQLLAEILAELKYQNLIQTLRCANTEAAIGLDQHLKLHGSSFKAEWMRRVQASS